MIPRNPLAVDPLVDPPSMFGNPANIIEASIARADRNRLEALSRALSVIESGRPKFHETAACRGAGVDFFDKRKASRSASFSLCGVCIHRTTCLDWAIEIGDFTDAVLGGMDGPARRRLAKERATSKEISDATA